MCEEIVYNFEMNIYRYNKQNLNVDECTLDRRESFFKDQNIYFQHYIEEIKEDKCSLLGFSMMTITRL